MTIIEQPVAIDGDKLQKFVPSTRSAPRSTPRWS